jgi:ABC-type polysaccharide/polyol phosphate transport system ATPase subunit
VISVEFDRVSKSYSIYEASGDRLKELALLNRRSFHRDFVALRDLTFSIRRGEVFCIIGENGSGKSTTLEIMAGILQPNSGAVRVNGRVSALLELGAGFNPEFTGRDNVYLNGAILGLSKREIDARYKQIEDFAEIGSFINQPVKTYSTGMAVRLAFAVAINVDPEILLVDEALAVGDTYFRHRCMRRIHELRDAGVTIVFVSHSIADVKAIGERVLWLRHGQAVALGETADVVSRYLAAMSEQTPAPIAESSVTIVDSIPNIDHRHGDRRAEVLGIALLNEFGEPLHLMESRSRIMVRISARAASRLTNPNIGFLLRNHLGLDFSETSTTGENHPLPPMDAGETLTVDFLLDIPELYPGSFSFSPFITDTATCDSIDNAITIQMARGEGPVYGYVQWPCRVELEHAVG